MAWEPSDERVGFGVMANVLVGVGFGFLIAAGLALSGAADWRRGLLWGWRIRHLRAGAFPQASS
ncbi:MAG: hypothetical protein U1E53_07450 [Dongiaceae bacterium]